MDLQKECFENRFKYSIRADENLGGLYVPKFILQPIIENSILHGFSQIRHEGEIEIHVTKGDGIINIRIHDNGIGIRKDMLNMLNSGAYSLGKYGLRNVGERIRLLCGDDSSYGVKYESNTRSRVAVTITLPTNLRGDDFFRQEGMACTR
jgi:two-component system sensor histidine kinase YesM